MNSVENLNTSKEKILSTIKFKGPSLPVQISREISFSPLFTSAFLSELKAEGKIEISNMRVGSSPLYYLPGQEEQLEKFSAYLNQREKEAFLLLKEKQVLEDSKQTPVVRVALRAIKDFAMPVKVRVDGESKLFWRYFSLSDEAVTEFASKGKLIGGKKNVSAPPTPKLLNQPSAEPRGDEVTAVENNLGGKVPEKSEEARKSLDEARPLAEKKQKKVKESEFAINVKDVLAARDVEIMHVVSEKKREFEAKIRIDTLFGKQGFYLIAKDKKSVTDNDLLSAEKKARSEKLPALVMSPGELNKKGRAHLEQWGNLVKYERLRF